jgi:DNA-binding transcriptional MerR regulator
MADDKRHPIQVVVRRTGLTADVLRAWERRYGAIVPNRSPSGRRLYSDDDIERLRLLKRASGGGRSIGQIASLPTARLATIVREDEAQEAKGGPADRASAEPRVEQYVGSAFAAVTDLDAAQLETVLSRATLALGAQDFLERVLAPVQERIGTGWRSGELSVAHEQWWPPRLEPTGRRRSSWPPRPGSGTISER